MINQFNRKAMEPITDILDWCLERSEKLSDEDSLALLKEFEEWQQWETGEIGNIEILNIPVNF